MRRVAFINEKGGTGKTTLAVNFAAYLARERGLKVLLMDLDTQGHAGKSLGLDVRALRPNAFHFLTDRAVKLAEVTHATAVENLFVVPAHKEMSELPVVLAQDPKRAKRLATRLDAEASAYDAVVFDAPPSMGLTTHNVLVAATEVVVPVALTYLALDGCAEIVETVREVGAANGRPELKVSRVVPTLYRKTALAEAILGKLSEYFPGLVTEPVGFNVKIDEAQSHGQTIWEYAPQSKGAQMLAQVAASIWDRTSSAGQAVA
jgi:chromosome partitioning protein